MTDESEQRCSVDGCDREGHITCDLCGEWVCRRHIEATTALELCPACHSGMNEGMPDEMRGAW